MRRKSKKYLFIYVTFILFCMIFLVYYFIAHNKSYQNQATEYGDDIYLNGVRYLETSELDKYTVTNVLICKTDTGRKLYKIKEYPDYEYIIGYAAWDGTVYKRDGADTVK